MLSFNDFNKKKHNKDYKIIKSRSNLPMFVLPNPLSQDDDEDREDGGFSDEFFYIATDKCTECKGFNEEPACAAVCPVDCCVDDEDHVESEEELLEKKDRLHA